MSNQELTGTAFKQQLRNGELKFGLFSNAISVTACEIVAHCGYDFVLVDCQHGAYNTVKLSAMLCAISSAGAKSLVRVASPEDRAGVQQALDLGADGVLIPYVNNAEEVRNAISFCQYPPMGTRSVYFPQRCTNKKGLLGYVGESNKEIIIAVQIETADSIKNIDAIAQVEGVDMLFLGQNDLCMSMGLFETYEYPKMYFSPELKQATDKLVQAAKRNNKILGLFLFGTERVAEFIQKGFTFISIGNDLHHIMTQAQSHLQALQQVPAKAGEGAAVVHPVPTKSTAPSRTASASSSASKKKADDKQIVVDFGHEGGNGANMALAAAAVSAVALLAFAVWKKVNAPQ